MIKQALRELLAWKADPALAAVELLAFWQGLELEFLRDAELDMLRVWNQFCDRFFTAA